MTEHRAIYKKIIRSIVGIITNRKQLKALPPCERRAAKQN